VGRSRACAVVGVFLGALVAVGVGATPAAATTCPVGPTGTTAVVLVVDRGTGAPEIRCVIVPTRASGADVLVAAYGPGGIRSDDPRRGAGFVCAIAGHPAAPECADIGQHYWSYWRGGPGGWTYAQIGAFGNRMTGTCVVEGWHFAATAQPPRVDPRGLGCATATATSPTTGTEPLPAIQGSVSSSGSPAPGPVAGSGTPAPPVPPGGDAPGDTSALGIPKEPAAPPGTVTVPPADAGPPAPPALAAPDADASSSQNGSDPSDAPGSRGPQEAAVALVGDTEGGAGPGPGLLLAALVAVALGGSAVVGRRRARRREVGVG
jgi:hypothetical protein